MSILYHLVNPVKLTPRKKAARRELKAEPNLRVDTTIVSGVAGAKTSEAARCRRRLPEERRAEVADRIVQVRVV